MANAEKPDRYRGETSDPDIKELHDTFDYATDAWRDIRDEARIDIRCIAGDVWEPADRAMRDAAGRPCLSLDEFGQYINQIVNEVRQNKRSIKVTPLGNGANDQTAATRADLMREIEYRSNAQQAYTTMFENGVNRSYGYLRVSPRYVSPRSRHQELIIDPIMNPELVTPDPDAIKPDLADIKFLFLQEPWHKTEFKKAFPKARFQSFTPQMQADAPRWVKDERIMLAEWWKIRTVQKKLFYFDLPGEPGQPPKELNLYEDELKNAPAGLRPIGERMADVPQVSMCLTNGLEILKEVEWRGRYIPFVGCFGKILYLNEGGGPTKRILSAIRLAIPPAKLYNYYRTGEAEQVGMATKFPYFVRRGSLKPEEAVKLQKSLHEPVEYIEIEAVGDNLPPGFIPEMPVRNPFEPAIQALEVGAEGARRAIQAAMGISPLPTSAQRRNEKSGVALKQIEDSSQKGTFHFVDHYEMSVTRTAVILDDLIPHYYDAARDLTVRKADDTPIQIRINDPNQPAKQGGDKSPYGDNPRVAGGEDHDITLSTGPSYDSEREAANDFSDVLVSKIDVIAAVAGPQAAAKILAMAIKLKNIGPLGNEMADIVSPPETGQPDPSQLMQQLQQAEAVIAELKSMADDNAVKLRIAEGKDATTRETTAVKVLADEEKTRMDNETKLAVAALSAEVDRLRLFVEERARLGVQAHEIGTSAMQHEQARELSEMGHAQGLEAGEVAHQQALEQGQQPPPIDPNAQLGAE